MTVVTLNGAERTFTCYETSLLTTWREQTSAVLAGETP